MAHTVTLQTATNPALGTNAGDIKKRLVLETGRYDLVVDASANDFTDDGALDVMNAAQKYMDRKTQHEKSDAWLYYPTVQGISKVTFKQARIVKEVWVVDGTNARTKIAKVTLETWRKTFAKPMAQLDQGTPTCWAPATLGLAPEQLIENAASLTALGLVDHDNIEFGDHFLLRGILLGPPPEKVYTIQILAEWGSRKLTSDTDTSFWTANHEELLLTACRYILEVRNRNRQGQADIRSALDPELREIANGFIAEKVNMPASDAVMKG